MTSIPQQHELLNHLTQLLQAHRHLFRQERVFQRVALLVVAEIIVFARHTITQLLMGLGLTEVDWSSWYRLFSQRRFPYDEASAVLFGESLKHVGPEAVYVVAGDSTQTPRSSGKLEGAHWLHHPQSPVFRRGIHIAQRWFDGSWLLPAENGYSRALPLRWLPAFTEKSQPQTTAPCKEWEAAVAFLRWLKQQLAAHGRAGQRLLMVVDGAYDTLDLWKHLPAGVILLARSAKNRVLYHLPGSDARRNRKYGERAPTPADYWRQRSGWQRLELLVRSRRRHLQVKVVGPFLRKGAPQRPSSSSWCGGRSARNANGDSPSLFWSMPSRTQPEGGPCLCRCLSCSSGPGSAGKLRWLIANSSPTSAWAISSAGSPQPLFSPFSGVPGPMPCSCWPAIAAGACPVAPPCPLAGGGAAVAGPSIPCGVAIAPPCGATTNSSRLTLDPG